MLNRENTSLGEYLIREGKLTQEKLDAAIAEQEKNGTPLIIALVETKACNAVDVAQAQSKIMGVPYIELRGHSLPPEIVKLVPGKVLRQHVVVPLEFSDESNSVLVLAMANPLDMDAQDDIALITGCMIEPRIATASDINLVLDKYYGSQEAQAAVDKFTKERESKIAAMEAAKEKGDSELENSPVVQLVRSIFEQAVRKRASDIHIDAHETEVVVRFRIDGSLVKVMGYDINMLPVMVTRLKIMGGMDISEKRKPQDGRITVEVDHSEYDVRVSILPTSYGEKVVMRIASTVALTRTKAQLGMRDHELTRFDHILSNPNGIILVTGPTGSGKSTTLYTALSALNDESVNIITVEDPVEANISGINQVQVNVKAGLTFASALRSILRQDPDIIMIGEIRDTETAEIAIQAAITGHLVVATLHTNSTEASVARLMNMGVEPYLIADALVGVVAQRLVRRLCTCKREREATPEEREELGVAEGTPLKISEPVGCQRCSHTGYFGRIAVYEMMPSSPRIHTAIAKMEPSSRIKEIALSEGMTTLQEQAMRLVREGITSMDELRKIAYEE